MKFSGGDNYHLGVVLDFSIFNFILKCEKSEPKKRCKIQNRKRKFKGKILFIETKAFQNEKGSETNGIKVIKRPLD